MKSGPILLAAAAALFASISPPADAATVPDARTYVRFSPGTGSVTNDYSVPSLSVSATAVPFGTASAESDLTYYFMVTNTDGSEGSAPVHIRASGNVSRTDGSANGSGSLLIHATFDAVHLTTDHSYFVDEFMNGPDGWNHLISVDLTRNLDLNVIYEVAMTTLASSGGGTGTAFLDPFFSVGSGYQLTFSAGIGNAAAVTPIPAALPLFASGLGGLGLVGWRRRKAAAIAA